MGLHKTSDTYIIGTMTPKKNQFKQRLEDLDQSDLAVSADFFAPDKTVDHPMETSGQHVGDDVWMASPDGYDGQLAIDVFQDEKFVYIRSIIGGIDPKNIEVHINNDMVTIKGKRIAPSDTVKAEHYFIQECYWGEFSRSIVLPVPVKEDEIEAMLKDGVLTISFSKVKQDTVKKIQVV